MEVIPQMKALVLSIEGTPEEINVHLKIFGKDPVEVNHDNMGSCHFCNCRIDEFNFCTRECIHFDEKRSFKRTLQVLLHV